MARAGSREVSSEVRVALPDRPGWPCLAGQAIKVPQSGVGGATVATGVLFNQHAGQLHLDQRGMGEGKRW